MITQGKFPIHRLTTSPHYVCKKCIVVTNENLYFDTIHLGFKGLKVYHVWNELALFMLIKTLTKQA